MTDKPIADDSFLEMKAQRLALESQTTMLKAELAAARHDFAKLERSLNDAWDERAKAQNERDEMEKSLAAIRQSRDYEQGCRAVCLKENDVLKEQVKAYEEALQYYVDNCSGPNIEREFRRTPTYEVAKAALVAASGKGTG